MSHEWKRPGGIARLIRLAFRFFRDGPDRPFIVRYTCATLWVAIAFAARFLLSPTFGERLPFAFFLTSSLLAAWSGGVGPGFFALALGVMLGDWFFLPPLNSLGHYGLLEWGLLLGNTIPACIGILLFESLHRRRRKLRADKRQMAEQLKRCAELERQLAATRSEVIKYATALERAVAERTAELNEAVQFMERFCYSIAHDLRAPLRAMIGFSHLLVQESDQKLRVEHGERVVAGALRMDKLLTDLLDYGRVSHQAIQLRKTNTERIVSEVLDSVRTQIEDTGAQVEVKGPLPIIWTDPHLLRQALGHLVMNAFQFAKPDTRLELTISAEEYAASTRFRIADNGLGIAPEHQEKIFAPFHTLKGSGGEHTGMGLAIVAKIIERLHGQIAVQSEPGKGTTFFIDVPNHPPPTRTPLRPQRAMSELHGPVLPYVSDSDT